MKNKQQFQQAVSTASKTLGGEFGVRVVFEGDKAMTDGKTIFIPALPPDASISKEEETVTTGFYCHESAHVRYTEMDYFKKHKGDAMESGQELLGHLINAVEDCFIEREWIKEYAGSQAPLSETHEFVDLNALGFMLEDDDHRVDWRHIGPMAITWMSGRDKGYEGAWREKCVEILGEGMEDKVSDWYDTYVKPVASTRDAVDAANKIRDLMIEDEQERQQQEVQDEKMSDDQAGSGEDQEGKGSNTSEDKYGGLGDGNGTNSQQGDQSNGNQSASDSNTGTEDDKASGGEAGQDKPHNQGEDEAKKGSGNRNAQLDETTGQEEEQSREVKGGDGAGGLASGAELKKDDGSVKPFSVDFDLSKALDVDKKRGIGTGKHWTEMEYNPYTEEYDCVVMPKGDCPVPDHPDAGEEWATPFRKRHGRWQYRWQHKSIHESYRLYQAVINDEKHGATYDEIVASSRNQLSVMKRKIQRAFLAKRSRDWVGGFEYGRLDNRMLTSAYAGHHDVWRQRTDAPEMDTATQILVDASGSMDGERMKMATLTSIALCSTLDGIGCATEVLSFTGKSFVDFQKVWPKSVDRFTFPGRTWAQWLLAHKHFDQPMRLAKNTLGSLADMANGGTPLADGVYIGGARLMKRREARRIMIIVTDGRPDNEFHAEKAIKYLQAKGVEVAGIGIGSDYIGEWCNRSVWVDKPDDLASTVMDDFAKMLLRNERFNANNKKGVAA